ncbi:MAG: FkbM family methyltransferase [Desulfobacterales bacterium]|nr:FkbM family methyltransferase [Desulfofustis sp.]NNK96444.1 FkbM family methyltransferase [Desulfobacterales bacterium]
MKILIDCGASNGSAIEELDNKYGPFDKIYAIEPNPENARHINSEESKLIKLEAAISTEYGNTNLYLSEKYDGSTLYPNKLSGRIDIDNFIEVKAIDFSDWLTINVSPDDYVVCKMDVEGAEFDVLEHLLKTKKMALINVLLVEWHPSRFPNPWKLRYRRFLIKMRLLFLPIISENWR